MVNLRHARATTALFKPQIHDFYERKYVKKNALYRTHNLYDFIFLNDKIPPHLKLSYKITECLLQVGNETF